MAVFNSYLKLPEGGNAEIDEPIQVTVTLVGTQFPITTMKNYPHWLISPVIISLHPSITIVIILIQYHVSILNGEYPLIPFLPCIKHVQFRYNLINIIILFYSEYVAIICHDDLCTHHLLDH